MGVTAPQPLSVEHDLEGFDCGNRELNDWLQKRAFANEEGGASRTYVVCDGQKVVAYYCLAVGAVQRSAVPGRVGRKMPDPVPVMVLGRLAVDQSLQGRGYGRALLRDAVLRTLSASSIAGIRAIFVHAISGDAQRFYQRWGFQASRIHPMTLMITIRDAVNALRATQKD